MAFSPQSYSGSVSLPEQVRAWGDERQGGPYSGAPSMPISAIPTPTSVSELGTLGNAINEQNRLAQLRANRSRIPRAAALENVSSGNILSELEGKVPDDVMKLLQQQGAEGATLSGGNPQAAFLRALGLTSLGLQQEGQQNLSAAYGRNPAAPIFDPSSQLLTPGQAGQLALGGGQLRLSAQEAADRAAIAARDRSMGIADNTVRNPRQQPSTADLGLPTFNYGAPGPTGETAYGLPDFTQADWWASIGYSPQAALPQQAASPAEQAINVDTG